MSETRFDFRPFGDDVPLDPNRNGEIKWAAENYQDHGQWEFQDPKMEVLYHIRPYFLGIFPYIGLT